MTHRSSEGNELFIVLVLLASVAWAHRALITKIEHDLLVIWLFGGIVFFSFLAYRFFKSRSRRLDIQKPIIYQVDNMTGLEFEKYVAQQLKSQGYKHVRLTEKYDLGVDIIAEKDGIRWGIQVKLYSGLVKADAVRQVVTALKSYNCDRAMVVTNSSFSQTAKELAGSNDCVLLDRDILNNWLDAS